MPAPGFSAPPATRRRASRPVAIIRMSPGPTLTPSARGVFELCPRDDRATVEMLDALRGGDVEEYATTDDTVGERHDRVGARAVGSHVARRAVVVHPAANEHV